MSYTHNPGTRGWDDLESNNERSGQEHIDKAAADLLRAKQSLAQTEDIAQNTSNQLKAQGEQLDNTGRMVDETRANTREAQTVIREMDLKQWFNKLKLYFCAFILFGAICGMIYAIVDKGNDDDN